MTRIRRSSGRHLALCGGLLLLQPLWLAACSADPDPSVPRSFGLRPDIVLVVVDSLRADHLGVYGNARPTSPNLDALAEAGGWFRRAYAHSGWTLPSLASLLTGQLPHQHRVGRDPFRSDRFGRLPADAETLAELLRLAGYRCGAVVNNTFLAPAFGLQQGFEGHYDYRGASRWEARSAETSVDAALEWFREQAPPRFLLLHLMEPHLSYDPPESVRHRFTGRGAPPLELPFVPDELFDQLRSGAAALGDDELDYVRKLYDEEILATDRALGRFFESLAGPTHEEGDLLLVVTSDHGEEFFDHGGFGHGHTLYSELTRVPLIARGPGVPRGAIDTIVQHVDLFLGILAVAGVAPPPGARGVDLFALARGEVEAGPRSALSENVLVGEPLVSLVDEQHFVEVDMQSRQAEVWRVDANGRETAQLDGRDLAEVGGRLSKEIERIRGDLEPVEAVGPEVPDLDTFLELKALGYVE